MDQAPQWGKKNKKRGQIGRISASEARHLSARFARRFFFSPMPIFLLFPPPSPAIRIKPGPRLTEGKIYVAVFCVDVNGDIKHVSSGGWKRALLFRKCDVC